MSGLAALSKNDAGKLRLVNFWSTTCVPCLEEMDDLVEIYRMYRHRAFEFVTVAVNYPDEKADVDNVLMHPTHKTVQAVSFNYDRERWQVLDKAIQPDMDYLETVSHGDINVTSEPGKGTRFEIVLPRHEPVARATSVAVNPRSTAEAARVLVVEDEEPVRMLLKDAFSAEGHSVTEAVTGAEALKLLDEKNFDLLVCDLGLPELSGLHVARWVKEFRPELPVIIATGYSEMIATEDYDKARIDEVIRKPFAVTDVLDRAHRLLNHQSESAPENVAMPVAREN